MTNGRAKLERCNYGCCHFINGRAVGAAEYEKETYPATSGRNRADSLVLCQNPCVKCGHSEKEHSAKGCLHQDELPPQPHGHHETRICECEGFRRPTISVPR